MNNILQQQLNSYWKIINDWNIILRKIWLFIKLIVFIEIFTPLSILSTHVSDQKSLNFGSMPMMP